MKITGVVHFFDDKVKIKIFHLCQISCSIALKHKVQKHNNITTHKSAETPVDMSVPFIHAT